MAQRGGSGGWPTGYPKTHRDEYYRLLQGVRTHGACEAWMEFFLRGVVETANNAYEGAIRIVGLFRSDRDRIIASADQPNSLLRLHDLLQARPFLAASQVRQLTGLSIPTINKSFETL